jgi:hypothetical protein
MTTELIVSAVAAELEVDVWRLLRDPSGFRSFRCDNPESVFTWKSGAGSYTRLRGDQPSWSFWQEAAKARGRKGKHVLSGHHRWADAVDPSLATDGTGIVTFESLGKFPRSKRRAGAYRLVVPLRAGQGLSGWHYLCRPDQAGALLTSLAEGRGETAWTWLCSAWDPWSIVDMRVLDEHSLAGD